MDFDRGEEEVSGWEEGGDAQVGRSEGEQRAVDRREDGCSTELACGDCATGDGYGGRAPGEEVVGVSSGKRKER